MPYVMLASPSGACIWKTARFESIPLPITHIHIYLVHPAKSVEEPEPIGGSDLALRGKMFWLLKDIYDRAEAECNIDISFNRDAEGAQHNACRDLLVAYAEGPTLVRGRRIAERLALHTDNRARMGLLFLVVGQEGDHHKLIISRFPADSGILAEQDGTTLSVEFLERIFMKSARAYKAVLYRHQSLAAGFWHGLAIDKQMNDAGADISAYWISDFLESDFRTTAAAGTMRLAVACREAARKAEKAELKSEIVAAVTLAGGQAGRRTSAREFVQRLGMSGDASTAILSEIKPQLADENFQFSADEFKKHVVYRSVELDNGGIMTAETEGFDRIFTSEVVDPDRKTIRYTTEGKIVREKLGKSIR
jgi:hypothetical protein